MIPPVLTYERNDFPLSIQILTVVQARVGSSRLPGKVLLPLAGKPLLCRMVERVKRARLSGHVVVASTIDPADDAIEALCGREGIACFRGDAHDLLDRHYQAARHYGADVVLKIPSDCPLIDPQAIDRVLGFFLEHRGQYDYVSNLHPATYPDGNDVEVMTMPALTRTWKESTRPLEREHTTPYLWDHPGRFRTANVAWETGRDYSMTHRWTIDYPEDYLFIQAVYEALFPHHPDFGTADVLRLVEQRKDIFRLNQQFAGVNWYRHHLHELQTIDISQTKMGELVPWPESEK